MTYSIGVIRVITLSDEKALKRHGDIIERTVPKIRTVSKCIEDQPKGIYDEESERIAIPKIIKLGKEFEEMKVHGIIISCASDPGVKELGEIVKIPVIGAGSATASIALAISDRVGVLGITNEAPKPYIDILGNYLVSYAKPEGVTTTLDIEHNIDAIIKAAMKLKDEGSRVIALACTGYSTIGIAPIIQQKVNIPVIDPVVASAIVMYHEVKRIYELGRLVK